MNIPVFIILGVDPAFLLSVELFLTQGAVEIRVMLTTSQSHLDEVREILPEYLLQEKKGEKLSITCVVKCEDVGSDYQELAFDAHSDITIYYSPFENTWFPFQALLLSEVFEKFFAFLLKAKVSEIETGLSNFVESLLEVDENKVATEADDEFDFDGDGEIPLLDCDSLDAIEQEENADLSSYWK